jgi:agmatine deiminase
MTGPFDASRFHIPAEWMPQQRVWVTRPRNPVLWPGCREQAMAQYDGFIASLRRAVDVTDTADVGIAADDAWARDYAPLFVVDDAGRLACHDFRFNAWGGKFEPYDRDDAAGRAIAEHLGLPCRSYDMVLEGGSIEVNGAGTVLTTEQCLLNPNRNPHLSRQQIEDAVLAALGARQLIWLPGGLTCDDTDGHIDDIARFVAEDVIVAVRAPEGHVDHAMLERNWEVLTQARDVRDRRFALVALPMPRPLTHVYPSEAGIEAQAGPHGRGGEMALPASYANFLISNGHVFVPVFDQAADDEALRVLESAMPGYTIVPVAARWLLVEGGAMHCLTMQQPRSRAI